MTDVIVPELNEDQAFAVLQASIKHGAYEVPNGSLPEDAAERKRDAEQLVRFALQAGQIGNKSALVTDLIFIAQVDQKPPIEPETPAPPQNEKLAGVSDGTLEHIYTTLTGYVATPDVEQQIAEVVAERERRNANQPAGQAVEEVSPQQTAGTAQSNGAPAPIPEDTSDESGIPGDNPREEVLPETEAAAEPTTDAGTFATVQTPETSAEAKGRASAKSPEKDGERAELNNKLMALTNPLAIIEKHGVDVTKLDKLPIDQLRAIVENPDGPQEPNVLSNDEKAVSGIDVTATAPVPEVTKADVGIEPDAPTSSGISSEREQLESELTGPTLKSYGRGRKEVPNIGDNELRLMIQNPDAKITPEELSLARVEDGTGPAPIPKSVAKAETVETQAPVAETSTVPNLDDLIAQSAPATASQNDVPAGVEPPTEVADTPPAETSTPATPPQVEVADNPRQKIYDLITKENLPVPPEITGEAPRLPNDVSQCGRLDLFSYHARFHACEARANVIISDLEDVYDDTAKLRKYKEAEVASSIPPIVDGQKVTNEFRDSQVRANAEVKQLVDKEHEEYKVIRKFKVLRDGYHRDCERLSRQISRFETEKNDGR